MNDWGHVYIIRSGHRYKIGYTTGPVKQRVSGVQVGSPMKVVLVCAIPVREPKKVESDIHQVFSSRRTRGEWYALTQQDIKNLKKEERRARKEYVQWQLERSEKRAADPWS